jgi:hypothetical protein
VAPAHSGYLGADRIAGCEAGCKNRCDENDNCHSTLSPGRSDADHQLNSHATKCIAIHPRNHIHPAIAARTAMTKKTNSAAPFGFDASNRVFDLIGTSLSF